MRNIKLPPLKKEQTFNFHKEGQDKEFDNAMASIQNMYSDIFSGDSYYNSLFENLKVDNNPILQPVSEMFKEVFDPQSVKDGKQYIKLSPAQAEHYKQQQNGLVLQDDEDEQGSLIVGEPVYLNKQSQWNNRL